MDPRAVLVRQIVSSKEGFDEVGASDFIEDDIGHLCSASVSRVLLGHAHQDQVLPQGSRPFQLI